MKEGRKNTGGGGEAGGRNEALCYLPSAGTNAAPGRLAEGSSAGARTEKLETKGGRKGGREAGDLAP